MITNDIGIPINKIHYKLTDVNKKVAIKHYVDRVKESGWLIDEQFKKYVSYSDVRCEIVRRCFTYIYFSCDCVQHIEDSGTIKKGYSITPNMHKTGYDVWENTSSYSNSYNQKVRKSFWVTDRVLPLSDRDFNMYEQKSYNTVSREEIKGFNDENQLIKEYILKYDRSWKQSAKDCREFQNYHIDKIELIYVDLCEISVDYEGKNYKVSDIIPTQLSNYNIEINEESVVMSEEYYIHKAEFSEKKEKVLNFGYACIFAISLCLLLTGLVFLMFINSKRPSDIANIFVFVLFSSVACAVYISWARIMIKDKKYNMEKVSSPDKIYNYLKSIKIVFTLNCIGALLIGLGGLLFGLFGTLY